MTNEEIANIYAQVAAAVHAEIANIAELAKKKSR